MENSVPHEYGPSRVGHGEAQCKWCLGTNRENAVIAPNHCAERARHRENTRPPSTEPNAGIEITPEWCTKMAELEGDAEIGAGFESIPVMLETKVTAPSVHPDAGPMSGVDGELPRIRTIELSDIGAAEKFRRGHGGKYDHDVAMLTAAFAWHRTEAMLEGVRLGLAAALEAAEPVVTEEFTPARDSTDEYGEPDRIPERRTKTYDYNAVARIHALVPEAIAGQGKGWRST